MNFGGMPSPLERPELWPWSLRVDEGTAASLAADGQASLVDGLSLRGRSLREILGSESTALVVDLQDLEGQANVWATAFAEEFWDGYGMNGGYVCYDGWGWSVPEVAQRLEAMGILRQKQDSDSPICVVTAPGQAVKDPRGEQAQQWIEAWRERESDCGIQAERLRVIEKGDEYTVGSSPLIRARELADFLRVVCEKTGRSVPTIEYIPQPGVIVHSCMKVDVSAGWVVPLCDDAEGRTIIPVA